MIMTRSLEFSATLTALIAIAVSLSVWWHCSMTTTTSTSASSGKPTNGKEENSQLKEDTTNNHETGSMEQSQDTKDNQAGTQDSSVQMKVKVSSLATDRTIFGDETTPKLVNETPSVPSKTDSAVPQPKAPADDDKGGTHAQRNAKISVNDIPDFTIELDDSDNDMF